MTKYGKTTRIQWKTWSFPHKSHEKLKVKEGGFTMVTNFDYLKNESKFSAFANVAISAEKIRLASHFDEYRGIQTVSGTGSLEKDGLYPQMWKQCGTQQ